ncbi:MAG: ATP-binding protein [Cyanobacteria bacterium P01_F01_bin.86]
MANSFPQNKSFTQNRSVEAVLHKVVQGTVSVTGEAFFPALVQNLASALGVRNCFVTELLPDNQLRTLAFVHDGKLEPNITYNPFSGPCGAVLEENTYYCPYGIQELFADHPILSALEADSYVGVCLQNGESKVLGNLVIIDSKPVLEHQLHESILKIFAARAAAELERQWAIIALQKLNEDLEVRVEQRTGDLQDTLKDLKHTQAQLVQSEKMSSLGQLVAGISHEINNPINFIAANLDYVTDYTNDLLQLVGKYQEVLPSPPPKIQKAIKACDLDFVIEDLHRILASMKTGSDRIQELVLSFRNFSRLGQVGKKSVDLHEGINNTLVLLSHRFKSSTKRPEIQVIKHFGLLPKVECCPEQLNQVFMNILTNAIDALDTDSDNQPTEPCIQVYTAAVDNFVEIRIANNGPTIEADIQQRMFEPFFTTKVVGEGIGLGLAISYQVVVEQHQGKLQCKSTPEEGTEFTIAVPIEASGQFDWTGAISLSELA